MQFEHKATGQYYDQFQVVDTIKFFNRKLILAKRPDGRDQVFLQEIEMNRFVPPGSGKCCAIFITPMWRPFMM